MRHTLPTPVCKPCEGLLVVAVLHSVDQKSLHLALDAKLMAH